jgi:predicted NBD/HSP70 family sugar kinase
MKEQYVLAYDFGGRQARAAIVGYDGILSRDNNQCRVQLEIPETCTNSELDQIALTLANKALDSAGMKSYQMAAIGFASAGTWRDLLIVNAPNNPVKKNITAAQFVQKQLGIQTFGANDLRAAVYGSLFFGHGRGLERLAVLTYSDGNNGAILDKGLHYPFDKDLSQEIGHDKFVNPELTHDARLCNCGARGCYEAYNSGTAAANIAREMFVMNPGYSLEGDPIIAEVMKGKSITPNEAVPLIKAEHVYRAFRTRGENTLGIASYVQHMQTKAITSQLASVMFHHRPQVIEVMGGMTKDWDLIFEPAIASLYDPKLYNQDLLMPCLVKRTLLGDDIGLLGVSAYVRTMLAREMEYSH